ncbi:arginase, hepatic [Agrilus planipennis]|uniref:Arginase n=1 Tax=Agrilus planipennis TaxID=224129 RepID=A0A1W4X3P2_AGRPL|nr:arginase, hepatic [Agrilus planipennis]
MFQRVVLNLRQDARRCISSKIGVLGVPFDKGQTKPGVANGPKSLRDAGLVEKIRNIHDYIDVVDYGDIAYSVDSSISKSVPNIRMYEHMVACNKEVSKRVRNIIESGRICLTLGGDHTIAVGTVDGHIQAKSENVCLLWVDAHADINTNKTSNSGNPHGMPMALLAKELSDYWPYLPGMDWQKPIISVRDVAYVGLRSVDNYERLIIDKLGITAFGMEDIEKYGIHDVVNMALDKIDPEQNKSIHVSFDIDSLDSLEAPSTGTSVRGGLTLREGIHIMENVYKTKRLGSMDLVEVNPAIGTTKDVQTTCDAAIHVILAAFGQTRRGLRPFNVDDMPLQTFANKNS